jgi:hypothetical protein
VETFTNVASACSVSPFTQTLWRTAIVQGTMYPAIVTTQTFAQPGTTSITYTFPDLLLTMLTPGELITLVSSSFLGSQTFYP